MEGLVPGLIVVLPGEVTPQVGCKGRAIPHLDRTRRCRGKDGLPDNRHGLDRGVHASNKLGVYLGGEML